MFLKDDDYFILMDHHKKDFSLLNEEELKQFYDTGMGILFLTYNHWSDREKKFGQVDWGWVDNYLEKGLRCGYRIMLPVCTDHLLCANDDWYMMKEDGSTTGMLVPGNPITGIEKSRVLSPWNPYAQEYMLKYYEEYVKRFSSEDVLIVNTHLEHGESFNVRYSIPWFDDWAIKDFKLKFGSDKSPSINDESAISWLKTKIINMMIKQQSILNKQQNKIIFSAIHPILRLQEIPKKIQNSLGIIETHGGNWIEELFSLYKLIFSDHQILWIIYSFMGWGVEKSIEIDSPNIFSKKIGKEIDKNIHKQVIDIKNKYKLKVYGGSKYVQGLPESTPKSIQIGIDGHITSPLHYFSNYSTIEPWMLDNIRNSIKQWENKNLLPQGFDCKEYRFLNPDLNHFNDQQLIKHYIATGVKENRKYTFILPDDFDCEDYKFLNPDLNHLNNEQLKEHYSNIGVKENRYYKFTVNLFS